MLSRRAPKTISRSTVALFGVVLAVGCTGGPSQGEGSGGAGDGAVAGSEKEAISVRVEPVRSEAISSSYSTSATLRADRRATVIARTRGVVERLAVEEGDGVLAGEPMAYLENDEQEIAAARARATAETAQRELDRLTDLLAQSLVSQEEFDQSRRDATDARHALELTELTLERTIIRAPFAGVVLTRFLDVGATVGDGTEVYELADLTPLYADINVPERHVIRLAAGQTVILRAEATERTVEAVIERIAPLVDPASGTVKVTVAIRGASALRPGAFVRVEIITDTHENALVVPRSALVAEGRRWHVFRLSGDGESVEQIEVRTGYESGERVEIAEVVDASTSLVAGASVVVAGAPALSEDSRVRVVADSQASDAR